MSAATVNISKKLADGSLAAIGGTDAEDFIQNLVHIVGQSTADDVLKDIADAFVPASAGGGFVQATANVAAAFPQAQPAQQSSAPAGTAPVCEHGYARVFKEGTSEKTGNKWKAWMCPLKRDEGPCAPKWVR